MKIYDYKRGPHIARAPFSVPGSQQADIAAKENPLLAESHVRYQTVWLHRKDRVSRLHNMIQKIFLITRRLGIDNDWITSENKRKYSKTPEG